MPLSEALAPSRSGFPSSLNNRDASVDRRFSAVLLGGLLGVASVYGVPQTIDPNVVKISLAGIEILTILMLARVARFHGQRDFLFLGVVLAAIFSKTVYGVAVANAVWNVPVIDALIEARFGIALFALPIIIRLFERASKVEIERILLSFTVTVLILDVVAVLIFPYLLSFGQRGAERFVLSMMGAAGIAYFYLNKSSSLGLRPHKFILALTSIWIVHVFLITTSRADSAVLAGLLITTILSAMRIRQNTVLAVLSIAVPVLLLLVTIFVINNDTLGGRDVVYFARELTNSFPTGVGFLPDSTRNASVVHFTPIFGSDYGAGLYVYRYGLLSIGILAALGFVMFQGIRGALRVPGAPVFMLAVMAYILVIPFWEYGALNGAILTAALLFVPRTKASSAVVTAEAT